MMSSLLVRLLGSESNIDREIDDAFATLIQTPWRQHAGRGLTSWPAVDVYDVDDALPGDWMKRTPFTAGWTSGSASWRRR